MPFSRHQLLSRSDVRVGETRTEDLSDAADYDIESGGGSMFEAFEYEGSRELTDFELSNAIAAATKTASRRSQAT